MPIIFRLLTDILGYLYIVITIYIYIYIYVHDKGDEGCVVRYKTEFKDNFERELFISNLK